MAKTSNRKQTTQSTPPTPKTSPETVGSSPLKRSGKISALLCALTLSGMVGWIAYDFGMVSVTGTKTGVDLKQRAYNTYVATKNTYARRGSIYDANGGILAEEVKSYTLTANLNENYGLSYVEDISETAKKLSTVLPLTESELYDKLNVKGRSQVEFGTAGRSLTYLEKKAIDELELPGISFTENSKRYYPMNTFASYALGYAVYDAEVERITGHLGLELYYDELLAGQNGTARYLRDIKGYQLPNTHSLVLEEAKEGSDIYTTIDPDIQQLLEEAFSKVEEIYQPEGLIGVVADAKTGAIVGMSNRETFDPNVRDLTSYYDPIVSTAFEPGSTMKIYTYAAAINEGVYPSGGYFESGRISEGGLTIKDWKPQGWGWITYDQGFHISSNVGIIHLIADYLDPSVYLDYLEAFGFGSPTGITLPNEASGTLPTGKDYTQVLTAGFGQGIMTTPIQHIQALTSIVNGGEMLKPYLVEKFYDPNTEEFVQADGRTVVGNPITAQTAEKMKQLMAGVVYDEKMGSGAVYGQMENIKTAGKTGTAQIPNPEGGGYLTESNAYVYSFAGFAPYDDPEYIIYLSIDRPKGGSMGGHGILSAVYRYLLEETLTGSATLELGTQDVAPETLTDEVEQVEVDLYYNLTLAEATEKALAQGLVPIILGTDGVIESQSPARATITTTGTRLILKTQGEITVPDLTKWTLSEVGTLESLTGRKVTLEGTGYVYRQSLAPGQVWNEGETLTLHLSLVPDQDRAIWEAEQLIQEREQAEAEAEAEAAEEVELPEEEAPVESPIEERPVEEAPTETTDESTPTE